MRIPALSAALFLALVTASSTRAAAQSIAQQPSSTIAAKLPGSEPPVMDNTLFAHVLVNQLEDRTNGPANELRWDGEAWIGTDMNRLWLKSEGFRTANNSSDGDDEALYDRPLPHLRYFDAQAGVREDLDSYSRRTWAALGVEGLAPFYFQLEPTLYIRDGGNIAGRITGTYDLLLTQRWIVQPEAELNFYNKDDPARLIGSGLSDLDTGIRLRYEITRKFAPYAGFAYNGRYGNSAIYARTAGQSTSDPRFVFGLRLWY